MHTRQEIQDIYWKFAAERQEIFIRRLNNIPLENGIWTTDPIFQEYKFCNSYRASDRVSQFLIKDVIYKKSYSAYNTLFRIIFFRLLNKIETWKLLEERFSDITYETFDKIEYSQFLNGLMSQGLKIYGNAFILCAIKAFGFDRKHHNHLALLEYIFTKGHVDEILASNCLKDLYENLKKLPLIGNFMAYQIAIDLNYSTLFNFDENDFTVAGPGAVRGIRKVFGPGSSVTSEERIIYMVENQDKEFERLGLDFKNLFGRKLHAIDCQGLFCETDKYLRVKMPELKSNRSKIKSTFKPNKEKLEYFYPPKWGLITQIQ